MAAASAGSSPGVAVFTAEVVDSFSIAFCFIVAYLLSNNPSCEVIISYKMPSALLKRKASEEPTDFATTEFHRWSLNPLISAQFNGASLSATISGRRSTEFVLGFHAPKRSFLSYLVTIDETKISCHHSARVYMTLELVDLGRLEISFIFYSLLVVSLAYFVARRSAVECSVSNHLVPLFPSNEMCSAVDPDLSD